MVEMSMMSTLWQQIQIRFKLGNKMKSESMDDDNWHFWDDLNLGTRYVVKMVISLGNIFKKTTFSDGNILGKKLEVGMGHIGRKFAEELRQSARISSLLIEREQFDHPHP